MREIVSKNPRIRAQNASAQAAQYDVALARWQYFPTPSVQAESFGLDRQVTASLSQPLLSFGRLATDVKAAQMRAGVAQERVAESGFALSFRVLDLFGQFVVASRAAEVMRVDVERLSALGQMISRRVTSGASAPVDLNLVLSRIRQSENAIVNFEARRASAVAGLSELLGQPIDAAAIIVPEGDAAQHSADQIATDATAVIEQSLGYSPVLRRAAREVDLARIDRQRAANALKPTVTVRLEQHMDKGRYDHDGIALR